MRRADRLLQIIQVMRRARGPVSGREIARELEVSLRTVYRDIVALEASGVPVRGEAGIGYVLEDGYDLPPLMFSAEELEIVMLGLRMAETRGDDAISRTARDAVAKIAAVLPGGLRDGFLDAPLYAPSPDALPKDRIELGRLREGLRSGHKVEILYQVPGRDPERRVVWPIVLAFFERARVLAAWCELRQDYRSFRTDRMLEMTVLDAKPPRGRKRLYAEWWALMKAESDCRPLETSEPLARATG
ncbi:YafY family protein [Stappia sp. ES.058]|uniref:helix-turn-helix transcriptional regulator n=1 Tax=Stappia sp. ES.058 TaxID=1881061 RepID=UPI00087C5A1E|nr:YafY family protein [Stappia sp. ES.058]SDU13285.1 Predicted DNA-binding transcriptional regulator YafY, contains an HTH and WYL domains [Stappia sp. ES.058]